MTLAEVADMIESIGVPFAYHHFPENTGQQPPFICFYYPSSNDLLADNINYTKINDLTIELYTDNKDFTLEAQIESTLNANGLVYDRDEAFIESEQMYMVTFYTGVLINEQD